MKNLIRKILKENREEKFFKFISSKLEPPYFYNLERLGINVEEDIEPIMTIIFDQPIKKITKPNVVRNLNDQILYFKDPTTKAWYVNIYDQNGNKIYAEDTFAWTLNKYDENGNKTNTKLGMKK